MSWGRRAALSLAVVLPIGLAGTLVHRAQARRIAAEEELIAVTKRKLAELADVQKQADELQRRKSEYEARIEAIERLRAVPSPKSLMEIAQAAESAHLVIDELSVSEMTLSLAFQAPSAQAADEFGQDLAARQLVANAVVQRGPKDGYSLRAVLLPRAAPTEAPPRLRP